MMYLRPGNLVKNMRVMRRETGLVRGHPVDGYQDTGETVRGVLAQAEDSNVDRYKHLWDQAQHSLTHTMVAHGTQGLRRGDMLTCDGRAWIVLYCDDIGALGAAGLVYLEERNDVK
jgi:hypothetical protein